MTARITYEGGLSCTATHLASGTPIVTDAPTDNHGRGLAFSPTDLLAAALGSCILTTMAIRARLSGWPEPGGTVEALKVMASDPRRVAELNLHINLTDPGYTPEQRQVLERIAYECPVARSLHPDLRQQVQLSWQVATPAA